MLACVLPFGDFFDHLGVERLKVIRGAAGDQALVHHHFLVTPVGAGVAQVGGEGMEGT